MKSAFFLILSLVIAGCSNNGTSPATGTDHSAPAMIPQSSELVSSSSANMTNSSSASVVEVQDAVFPSSGSSDGASGEVCLSDFGYFGHDYTSDPSLTVEESCKKIKVKDSSGNEVAEIKFLGDCSIRIELAQSDTTINICP